MLKFNLAACLTLLNSLHQQKTGLALRYFDALYLNTVILIHLPLCFTDGHSEDHSAIDNTHLSSPHFQNPTPAQLDHQTHTDTLNTSTASSSSLPATQIAFDDLRESTQTC